MAPNIYTIHIDSYRTSVKLGWSKEERICSQLVIINFILTIVAPNVPSSDHIHDTIDYDEIVNAIEGHISIGEWRLIEKLVFDLAHLILGKISNSCRYYRSS